ncbi:MAG: glycosyltransferase family 9 protein [Methylotenera sp.]|nr:glycosyltransferase family 9 protein [Oligoflexia bacterium]
MNRADAKNSEISSDPKFALNILVARPDRLGDVLLSTPVFSVLKKHYPHARITALVRDPVVSVLKGLSSIDDILVFDPERKHAGVRGFFTLMEEIRNRNFQISVVLQSHLKVAAALYGAGVPNRLGPLGKPHSYFFYNRGVRQRRSQVEMHETDYNLQLLRKLGIRPLSRVISTEAHVSEGALAYSRVWLENQGISLEKSPDKRKLIIVHPGMGGSALNWPEKHYLDLIRALLKEKHQVLVTGGPTEGPLLKRIQDELATSAEKPFFYGGPGTGTVDYLAGLMTYADLIIAPSTGPLHLAVALGKPVVSFYPPVRVQSAIRWGPYMTDETKASVLVPEVYCGQDFNCIGSLCNYHPCMKSLTVNQALEQVRLQLARHIDLLP